MMSRGRMFFSIRFLKAGPTDSHSSNFSLYSAGNEESPGRVIPSASAALAIVFAVYIWRTKVNGLKFAVTMPTYPSTGPRPGTGVTNGIITFPLSRFRPTVLQVFTIRLER